MIQTKLTRWLFGCHSLSSFHKLPPTLHPPDMTIITIHFAVLHHLTVLQPLYSSYYSSYIVVCCCYYRGAMIASNMMADLARVSQRQLSPPSAASVMSGSSSPTELDKQAALRDDVCQVRCHASLHTVSQLQIHTNKLYLKYANWLLKTYKLNYLCISLLYLHIESNKSADMLIAIAISDSWPKLQGKHTQSCPLLNVVFDLNFSGCYNMITHVYSRLWRNDNNKYVILCSCCCTELSVLIPLVSVILTWWC